MFYVTPFELPIGTAQIKDASITDAKIVSLSANSITAGTLAVERLVIVGSNKSIVFAINEANGTVQLSQTTIDGGSLTQRTITADRIIAGAITVQTDYGILFKFKDGRRFRRRRAYAECRTSGRSPADLSEDEGERLV